jgi:hypothetical protein
MNGNGRESKVVDDTAPFDFRVAKVDEQGEVQSRDPQIIDALSQMFAGELLDALHFDQQAPVNNQICGVRAHVFALIADRETSLGFNANATKAEFLD